MLRYKPVGRTMGDFMNEIKQEFPDRPSCFSGRLDPMAHGQVMILFDDEVKKCREYDKKDKTYEFQVIGGIQTDTTDILGKITNILEVDEFAIIPKFLAFNGRTCRQEYHHYSSMTIRKKPLWWYANNGKLNEITIPSKEVTIYTIEHLETTEEPIKDTILARLDSIKDHIEFRTTEIIEQWNNFVFDEKYKIYKFRTTVSSGTYIRQLVKDTDPNLLVYDIHRIII